MSRTLIQIVPALPPATSGVGDYAVALAQVMRRDFGLDTLFVVGNAGWQGAEEVDGFRVRRVAARSADDLAALLEVVGRSVAPANVLLQLSGYGYALRGCPYWLLQGLKQWRIKQPDVRLVTMFHELYAFGPPWRSAFWLSPAQRMVIAGLARISDVAVTNIQRYRQSLEGFDPSKREKIAVLAVPSNVGEPSESCELNARSRNMIVFGLPGPRLRTYRRQGAALQWACAQFGITEVHDVGATAGGVPERIGDVRVSKHGLMSASDLSSLLSCSMVGFLDYYPGYLAKSGVFASYCAHGLLPVTACDFRSEADGIECGVHYHSVRGNGRSEVQPAKAQSIADAARRWYQGHSLESHARTFACALLKELA